MTTLVNNTAAKVRTAQDIQQFERLDAALLDLALSLGAEPLQFPSLVCRSVLEKAEYPKAFPHLLLAAAPAKDPGITGPALIEPANLGSPHWCLSPAVCYHAYAHLAGQRLDSPRVLTARGRCFRHEAFFDPGRRQLEFEMREIILIGPARWVDENALAFKEKLTSLMIHLGLPGGWQAAQDPFFLPAAKGQAIMQQLKETKVEYCTPEPDPLALASVNRHEDFFGRRFEILDSTGRHAHTCCLAAGLDRWCHTLTHPATPNHIPTPDQIIASLAVALPALAPRLSRDQPLRGMGIDSIDTVDLLFMVESLFKVQVVESDLQRANTIADLADCIAKKIQQKGTPQ